MRVVAGGQNAAAGLRPKRLQAGPKAAGPRLVVACKTFGGAGAAGGVAHIKRRCGLGRGQVNCGLRQGGQHRLTDRRRPVGVTHRGAAAAGDDAQKINQPLRNGLALVDQHSGWGLRLAQGAGALSHPVMQLGKGEGLVAMLNGDGVSPGLRPVGQRRMDQVSALARVHYRARPPKRQSGRPRATV